MIFIFGWYLSNNLKENQKYYQLNIVKKLQALTIGKFYCNLFFTFEGLKINLANYNYYPNVTFLVILIKFYWRTQKKNSQ